MTPAPTRTAAALAGVARRLGAPAPAPWSPPPLAELIERIDAALADRRG